MKLSADQSKFPVQSTTKKLLIENHYEPLFTDQSEVSSLPVRCKGNGGYKFLPVNGKIPIYVASNENKFKIVNFNFKF